MRLGDSRTRTVWASVGRALWRLALGGMAACLLLARVDGKSPVDYFDPEQANRARALGRRLLVEGATDLAPLWDHP